VHRHRISNALGILCLQQLFECAFYTALISELVWKRIPDGKTGGTSGEDDSKRKWMTEV